MRQQKQLRVLRVPTVLLLFFIFLGRYQAFADVHLAVGVNFINSNQAVDGQGSFAGIGSDISFKQTDMGIDFLVYAGQEWGFLGYLSVIILDLKSQLVDELASADYNGFGFDFLAGAAYRIEYYDFLYIILGWGLHSNGLYLLGKSGDDISTDSLLLGLGIIADIQFLLVPGFGLNAGFMFSYDFVPLRIATGAVLKSRGSNISTNITFGVFFYF